MHYLEVEGLFMQWLIVSCRMEPSEELCRFTRPGRKRPGLARAMWDLPLLGNLPSHLQNGYEATPNRVVTASKLTVPDVAVDILTNGVAALELTTTTDTDQPVNLAVELNDASGKGLSKYCAYRFGLRKMVVDSVKI